MQNAGLLIRDSEGTTLGVTLCNEKSRNKTLERGELWVVDPNTGRVLPFAGGGKAVVAMSGRDNWYEATLGDNHQSPATDTDTAVASVTPDTADSEAKSPPGSATGSVPESATGSATGNAEHIGTVLANLTEIISERHRTMPEGSYTTHLFSKGRAKIRKKTGEEAVELILAENRDELTSEAADLIYHLMVLLEAEDLTMGDVIDVLAHRF